MTAQERPAEPSSRRLLDLPASDRAPASTTSTTSATSTTARTTIDTIVQSSTVELFHAHGLAVAPLGSSPVGSQQRYNECVGLIGFDASTFSGTLTLSLPNAVYTTHAEPRDPSDSTTQVVKEGDVILF